LGNVIMPARISHNQKAKIEIIPQLSGVTTEDVKRVLEIGQILSSVLTKEELDQLRMFLHGRVLTYYIQVITCKDR